MANLASRSRLSNVVCQLEAFRNRLRLRGLRIGECPACRIVVNIELAVADKINFAFEGGRSFRRTTKRSENVRCVRWRYRRRSPAPLVLLFVCSHNTNTLAVHWWTHTFCTTNWSVTRPSVSRVFACLQCDDVRLAWLDRPRKPYFGSRGLAGKLYVQLITTACRHCDDYSSTYYGRKSV